MEVLTGLVEKSPHIEIIEGQNAVELHQENDAVYGVTIQNSVKETYIKSGCIILATGGIGQLYRVTTNSKEALGDGVGMAARCGAVLSDMEFVQFHPTAFDI